MNELWWMVLLGQAATIVTVLVSVIHLHRKFVEQSLQHGMMWRDYISRHGINGSGPKPCAAHIHYQSSDIVGSERQGI